MRAELVRVDVRVERTVGPPANEKPVRQIRSITAAIACPKPMHIVATP